MNFMTGIFRCLSCANRNAQWADIQAALFVYSPVRELRLVRLVSSQLRDVWCRLLTDTATLNFEERCRILLGTGCTMETTTISIVHDETALTALWHCADSSVCV